MIQFEVWDQLLHQYVDRQGRVNYAVWQRESAGRLQQWLDQIAQEDWRKCEPETQLALWLNLYNALTIAQILRVYPIQSIQPKILGLPNWLGFFQFFERSIYEFNGEQYSLNRIEHKVLRQQFTEPRIHFALVCASIGCPLLRSEAYQPETVQQQLEGDALRFINNPDKVRYDANANILYCSKIFKWYGQDFLKIAPSIPAYIRNYLQTEREIREDGAIAYLPYDWNLNRQ